MSLRDVYNKQLEKSMSGFNSAAVREYLIELQDLIVDRLEQVDGRKFLRDSWDRPEGGGGRSCILEEGNVLERGGVAFSHVMGDKMPPSATEHRPELAGRRWEAMGVSLVFHPRNPYAPTVHMNVRMFVAMKDGTAPVLRFRRRRGAFPPGLQEFARAVRC